mmetsp:Transcript_31232/g.61832  ORF Transcript_31232/g.61832 Transcript_31232/m.61832 type:complete len:418 (-) Transcript_31232:23-1276(-)
MGKPSRRIAKRTRVLEEELTSNKAEKAVESKFTAASDASLFVLDTAAAPVSKSQLKKDAALRKKELKLGKAVGKDKLSKTEELKVSSMLSKHQDDAEKLDAIASEGRKRVFPTRKNVRVGGAGTRVLEEGIKYDLWADDGVKKGKSRKSRAKNKTGRLVEVRGKKRPTVAVELAHPGQSYNPDAEFHQEALGEALAIEVRRTEAEVYRSLPVGGGGMSEETKAVLVGDDDDSSSDEEAPAAGTAKPRLDKKITKAQRNRQRRARAEEIKALKRKADKRLLADATDSVVITKRLKREESETASMRKAKAGLITARDGVALGTRIFERLADVDIHKAPTFPVALSAEIAGRNPDGSGPSEPHSLRSLRTKGSLIKERLESMADRKLTSKRTVVTRKIVQGKMRRKIRGRGNRVGDYLLT